MDIIIGLLALRCGWWMMHPGWMLHRYPAVVRNMEQMAPVWIWAGLLIVKGLAAIVSAQMDWNLILVAAHLAGAGLWVFLWGFFDVHQPPMLEYLCPVMAWACFVRTLQIPKPLPRSAG